MCEADTPADIELRQRLLQMTTATATHLLSRRGYGSQFMAGALANQRGSRLCGRAVTVRLGPARPDLSFGEHERRQDPLWQAIESILDGDVLVVDCGGDVRAGTTGDQGHGEFAVLVTRRARQRIYPPSADVLRRFEAWKQQP
jgi:regulator of RNase E activity RraA